MHLLPEELSLGACQWTVILNYNFTPDFGFTIRNYAASKQSMQVVLEKYDVEKDKDRIELVVANRRRSLQYDIQASDWDEGQKQLQKCLRHFAKSKSRGYYSLPVTYGIVAIGGYAKFYTVLSR
jgi:hypothetical protein